MEKTLKYIIISLILLLTPAEVEAQVFNGSYFNVPGTNIGYNIFSNNLTYNSNYLYAHKNLGNAPLRNYYNIPYRYNPYNYQRYNNLPAQIYGQFSLGAVPFGYYTNPNIVLPVKRHGNPKINVHTRKLKPQKVYIYSY